MADHRERWMLTRIEIDGFKTFEDFSLDLGPLAVIAGSNAAGKSNLFDAIQLLARITTWDVRTAVTGLRGDPHELFRRHADGGRDDRIRLAVEVLLPTSVRDAWGAEHPLAHTRLRYEVELQEREDKRIRRLFVVHEWTGPILRKLDVWAQQSSISPAFRESYLKYGKKSPLLETFEEDDKRFFGIRHDGHAGRKRNLPAHAAEATVLSSMNTAEFPHLFALAEELRGLRLLQFDPHVLRQTSSRHAPEHLTPRGENLPTTLARLRNESADDDRPEGVLADIGADLASLIPGLLGIELVEDEANDRWELNIRSAHEPAFTARVASDGTLRLLGLLSLLNDPTQGGVICFEEPENGIHPARLQILVAYLRDLVSDVTTEDADPTEPLLQLLVTTHSPVVVAHLQEGEGSYFDVGRRVGGGQPSERFTRSRPITWQEKLPLGEERLTVSRQEVEQYLSSAKPAA
jgi:predicted ATPase